MGNREVGGVECGDGLFCQFIVAGHHVAGEYEPEGLGGHDTDPDAYELLL